MTTGKNEPEMGKFGRVSPFPVRKVLEYGCQVLRGLEGILRATSLYLYKNDLIDRKWMNVLMFVTNLLQFVCNSLSTDNKLKDRK